jgi:HPt (histidine-containing phosphotransfer) domain-containing protein
MEKGILMGSISKENTPSVISFPSIHGVDTSKGIAMTGGTAEGYRQVLSMFRKDADERLQKLRFFIYEGLSAGKGKFPEKHLSTFITQVHALKSASATIGAAEVSGEAARLDAAAKNKELAFLYDNLPNFVELLAELVKNTRTAIESMPGENISKSGGMGFFKQMFAKQKPEKPAPSKTGSEEYISVFHKLKNAIASQNHSEIDQILDDLKQKPLDTKTKEILEHVSDEVLMTEFDRAVKTIDDLIDTIK